MSDWAREPVRVRTPATSANLGPGFDAFGLALGWHDELTAEVTKGGLEVVVTGIGADRVPRDEHHLIVRAMRVTFARLCGQPPGLRVVCENRIPHGRGLGSSAAAICAGVTAANALVGDGKSLDADGLLEIAADIEGHPDNVAACLRGALTIAWTEAASAATGAARHEPQDATAAGGRATKAASAAAASAAAGAVAGAVAGGAAVPLRGAARRVGAVTVKPVADVVPVVWVPATPLSTEMARGLLPGSVPHADAAFTAGRAGLLVAALTAPMPAAERRGLLLVATDERLHQRYRAPAMPESAELIERLRARGVAAVVSGAGPTVLAFVVDGDPDGNITRTPLVSPVSEAWETRRLPVDAHGVQVIRATRGNL